MARVGKRRAVAEEDAEASQSAAEEDEEVPHRRRRRVQETSDDESGDANDHDQNSDEIGGHEEAEDSLSQLVKKFVRYAMACDYARAPIRRDDVRAKVFGEHKNHGWKTVFDATQSALRHTFGMEMTMLPSRDKVTLKERMAAAKTAGAVAASNVWVLTSMLPPAYRNPAIIPPSSVPTSAADSAYIGIYSMIVSLISLNGGKLADGKLVRYLERLNAEINTPIDKTEIVLARMQKQGYIVKVKENTGGEEVVEWIVGPRGKIEVGDIGVKGLVEGVYGGAAPPDLDERIRLSLGMEKKIERRQGRNGVSTEDELGQSSARAGRGRPRRERVEEDD